MFHCSVTLANLRTGFWSKNIEQLHSVVGAVTFACLTAVKLFCIFMASITQIS